MVVVTEVLSVVNSLETVMVEEEMVDLNDVTVVVLAEMVEHDVKVVLTVKEVQLVKVEHIVKAVLAEKVDW